MYRKEALALLTAAFMLFGNAAVFPAIAVSAAEKGSQTATKDETPDLVLDVPINGSEVAFTADQLSKVKYFTVKFTPKKVDWAAVAAYRVPGGNWDKVDWDGGYEGASMYMPDSSETYTAIVSLKDILAKVGKLEDGDLLVFCGSGDDGKDIKSFTVTPHSRRPDIELNTGSIASGTIEEEKDWTPDGEIPNGKTDLRFGDITLIQNGGETSFKGYKTLKIDYTVEDTSQLASVMVIFHGWESNSVGWKELSYKVKSSGTITIDLAPYQNKTYHNIYVRAVAPKTAKIGDQFAPGLTVTSAKLVSSDVSASGSSSGGSSAAPSNIKASKTTNSVTLSWDKASGADMYRVYKYNDKTGKYEKYKDVKSAKCTVSGLKAGTKYKFKVVAYSKNNDGKYVKGESSKAVSVTTKS